MTEIVREIVHQPLDVTNDLPPDECVGMADGSGIMLLALRGSDLFVTIVRESKRAFRRGEHCVPIASHDHFFQVQSD